jgi:hypothetical protein
VHHHQPDEEEVFRKARKNFINAALKMFGFVAGFFSAIAYWIIKGSSAFRPGVNAYYGRTVGPTMPLIFILVFTGLAIVLGIPDLKKSCSEYQKARRRRNATNNKKSNLSSPAPPLADKSRI